MKTCIKCGSHAFNLYAEEIDQGGLCDVHYWQGRAHRAEALAQDKQSPSQAPVAWEQFYPDIGKPQLGQEPVAIYRAGQAKGEGFHVEFLKEMGDDEVLFYTTPPKRPWVGLTDDEASWCQAPSTIQTWKRIEDKLKAKQAWTENDWDGHVDIPKLIQLVRADEREKVLAGERIRIRQRLDTLKTAIALLKAENTELKARRRTYD